MPKLLIELQYLAPIRYYAKLLQYQDIVLEKHENFVKSTYRNRCYIAGPNGKQMLSIPLEGGKSQHSPYTDVKISYTEDWQKLHWQSLCSSYRSSPYFEYYEPDLEAFYQGKYDYLFDFNLQLMQVLIRLLGFDVSITFTEQYETSPAEILDYRNAIHPNPSKQREDDNYQSPAYLQTFEERTGFIPDLSIVDLLFNQGPASKTLIHSAIVRQV